MIAAFLLAVTIAHPRAGASLPCVDRCYMIGAVEPGVTNIVVQGRNVPVYRTGAWATMVDVKSGTNVIQVAHSNHCFTVAEPPKPPKPGAKPPKPRVFEKLPYAGDRPKAHPSGKAPSQITVVIDAGHGGRDSGALSPHGIEEKDANLRMARALELELKKIGYNVVMTRTNDVAIALYDRAKIAHAVNADAFVSIHHNAPPVNKDPRLFRYTAVYAWNDIGMALAGAVNARMAGALAPEVVNNGVPKANYAVTRNPEIPSCLVEVDFITSPEGEEASWDPLRRRKVAFAMAQGIADWARKADSSR